MIIRVYDVIAEYERRMRQEVPLPAEWQVSTDARIMAAVLVEAVNRALGLKADRIHDHGDPGDE